MADWLSMRSRGGGRGVAKLPHELAHPQDLLGGLHCRNVLSLCGGQGNHRLKFAAPTDCSSPQLDQITSSGLAIVSVPSMVCIRVGQEGLLGLVSCGSIHKLQVQGALQIPVLKMAVSTSHVVVGIFLIVHSSIDHINITLPFSLIMCCNRL